LLPSLEFISTFLFYSIKRLKGVVVVVVVVVVCTVNSTYVSFCIHFLPFFAILPFFLPFRHSCHSRLAEEVQQQCDSVACMLASEP
jgi:hypothetical protein